MVRERIDAQLPEILRALAVERIEQRIGLLSLAEAGALLKCKNERQLKALLGRMQVPVQTLTSKKLFVRLADIEAALGRNGKTYGAPVVVGRDREGVAA